MTDLKSILLTKRTLETHQGIRELKPSGVYLESSVRLVSTS